VKGLYIHIPFCVKKCGYCDFYSLPVRSNALESYVAAVLKEAGIYHGLSFRTLYLGGGTPSLLGSTHLRNLIDGIRKSLDISELMEATIEVNPESATPGFLQAVKEAGIDRVSIGVQSLSDYELRAAGRIHHAAQAVAAITIAKKFSFKSISADLIIGLPGQTWSTLRNSLEMLNSLNIQHLSVYCLSLEEGTPLAESPPDDLVSDDEQAELYEKTREFLSGCGFNHYEISNFARQGYECQHNLNYWRGGEYLGLGPSAASHLGDKRFKNRADLDAYLAGPTGQTEYVEELDRKHKAAEEAMLRLRLLEEGIEPGELAARFGPDNVAALTGQFDAMVREGLLIRENSRYRLHPSRVLTSNPIFARVLST